VGNRGGEDDGAGTNGEVDSVCVAMCATRAFSASMSDGGPSCQGPCGGGRAGVADGVGRLHDVQPVVPGVGVGGGRRALGCRSMPRDCA